MDANFQWAITVFAGVAAAALLIQVFVLIGIYRTAKTTEQRISGFIDRAEPLADTALRTVEDVRHQAREILGKANQIAEMTRGQVARIDDLLVEAGDRARVQMDRIDRVMETTMERAEETTAQVQKTILGPVREIQAWAAGVRAVVEFLGRRRVSSIERATQDEELFI
jgi:uncharacterized protein YoxC